MDNPFNYNFKSCITLLYGFYYLAYDTERVSRITVIFT